MGSYFLSPSDNDTYAFRARPVLTEYQEIHQSILPDMSGTSRTGLRRCEACGQLLRKWDEPLEEIRIKKRKYDYSITYDGVTIVSPRFRWCYSSNSLVGLEFRELPDDRDFFAIRPTRVVRYDADTRGTTFDKLCPKCGRFGEVIGATPVFLVSGTSIGENEFVRTDLEFGSADEQSPLVLCGQKSADVLAVAKLRGVGLRPCVLPP